MRGSVSRLDYPCKKSNTEFYTATIFVKVISLWSEMKAKELAFYRKVLPVLSAVYIDTRGFEKWNSQCGFECFVRCGSENMNRARLYRLMLQRGKLEITIISVIGRFSRFDQHLGQSLQTLSYSIH